MAVSPLDCMGCAVCISQCPANAIEMAPMESQLPEQEVWNYMVSKVAEKEDMVDTSNVKFSQFAQPYLEFSGSCAGCAETSYARLVTQLFGDHMLISNATGCSSIWGGPAATSPYTVNKKGQGPAWANSLFEDNAEHGLGMYLGQKKIREDLKAKVIEMMNAPSCCPELKEAAQNWLDTYDDGAKNQAATKALIKELEEDISSIDSCIAFLSSDMGKQIYGDAQPAALKAAEEAKAAGSKICTCPACQRGAEILAKKDYLNKKSVWIFGGDGWAFDIGFGGVDHVLASGEDINIFVFNTEVYSNTGGQASKASNIGQVAQFAAAGKEIKAKSLAEIAMTYGYVYVAQVAMGANKVQTLKAITEAEAHKGPSLIIGYSPCEMHSIKGGMTNCQKEMEKAVKCGYWNLFRFNPDADKPFTLDSKEPAGGYREFLMNEARYSRLTREFPERAERLFTENEEEAKKRYDHLTKLKDMDIELVILAGYDLPLGVIPYQFKNRVIGTFPALFPAFEDAEGDIQRAVLERGVKVTGATAYFADGDGRVGSIILQRAVEVKPDDTPESLGQRVLEEGEWRILSQSVILYCSHRLKIRGNRVLIEK